MSRRRDEVIKHLSVLELEPGASLADVKQAYRDLARVWHPDRFADGRLAIKAEARLKQVNAAYEWLQKHPDELLRVRTPNRERPAIEPEGVGAFESAMHEATPREAESDRRAGSDEPAGRADDGTGPATGAEQPAEPASAEPKAVEPEAGAPNARVATPPRWHRGAVFAAMFLAIGVGATVLGRHAVVPELKPVPLPAPAAPHAALSLGDEGPAQPAALQEWVGRVFPAGTETLYVQLSGVQIREGPGLDYAAIRTLRPGERVAAADDVGGWRRVVEEDDPLVTAGWVQGALLGQRPVAAGDPAKVTGGTRGATGQR